MSMRVSLAQLCILFLTGSRGRDVAHLGIAFARDGPLGVAICKDPLLSLQKSRISAQIIYQSRWANPSEKTAVFRTERPDATDIPNQMAPGDTAVGSTPTTVKQDCRVPTPMPASIAGQTQGIAGAPG